MQITQACTAWENSMYVNVNKDAGEIAVVCPRGDTRSHSGIALSLFSLSHRIIPRVALIYLLCRHSHSDDPSPHIKEEETF